MPSSKFEPKLCCWKVSTELNCSSFEIVQEFDGMIMVELSSSTVASDQKLSSIGGIVVSSDSVSSLLIMLLLFMFLNDEKSLEEVHADADDDDVRVLELESDRLIF